MSLCMIVSLLPMSAMAFWGGSSWGQDNNTVVRFYVVGTGSKQGYDVENQPVSGMNPITLYVTEDCALIEDLTVEDSSAPQETKYNQGDSTVRAWLEKYADGVPDELADIDTIVNTVNSVYKKHNIPTELKTDYFNTYEFESANWINSDRAYHVHVRLFRQECTVTFDYNYEGAPDAEQTPVGKGTAVNEPEDPTREGYDFTGWYTNSECTTLYDFSALVTENITLYAGWKEKEPEGPPITVTKELATVNDVDVSDKGNVVLYDGDKVNWTIKITNNTNEQIIVKIADTVKYTDKQEVNSKEEILTNHLTDSVPDSGFNSDYVGIGAKETKEISLITTFEVDSGEYQDYEGGTLTNTATVTYKDQKYPAEAKNSIGYILTVTYDGNGGTVGGTEDGDKTVKKTVRAPELPHAYTVESGSLGFQKSGYEFGGWYEDQGCTDPVDTTEELPAGATYFAKWTKVTEPVDPATDIFFFISLPSNDKAMSGEEEDYRYLTHGGVIDKNAAGIKDIDATGIISLDNESEITKFVETWPAGTNNSLGNESDVGFDVASPSVGSDSWWTIDASGKVSEFSIKITDEKNKEHTYTSADYGIRWAKISYATTADPDDSNLNNSMRYHVDGVLYSKETVDNVLSKGKFQKTVDSDTLSYNDQGTANASEGFSFVLDMLTGENGQPSNAFDDIELTATVTSVGTPATITLPADSTAGSTPLTPGYYVIQETLEGDQAKAWTTPASIYFELTSNGNVRIENDDNTINNTLETYTLTYDLGGAAGTVPTGGSYKYNQNVTVAAAPTWTGHTFQGWTDGTTTYQPGDTIQIKETTTLTAQWDDIQYTLTYDANGGTGAPGPDTNLLAGPHTLNDSTVPTYGSNIFLGWTADGSASGKIYEAGQQLPTIVTSVTIPDTDTVYAVWGEDSNNDEVADVYEVFIAPADITIYTGGTGYEGVTNDEGVAINNPDSGLPKPGFHIILPADLGLGDGNVLDGIVKFQYNGLDSITGTDVSREWTLSYVGIYSDTPRQYVYSLESAPNTPAIRVTYTDPESNEVLPDDDIGMTEDAAHGTYTMSINHGGLTPTAIQAEITKLDGSKVTRSLVIGTGELTIRSTVDNDTTAIVDHENSVTTGDFTAVGNNASYVVNDSQVPVTTANNRVQLLVDDVSDSTAFNNAMGEAALDHPQVNGTAYETAYLDLVDTQNGNTVVTLNSGSMDIYWPMPADADPSGTFQVVHYRDMNRENTVDADNLAAQTTEVLTGTPVYTNGNWYVRFNTNSFSPFVLVYEEKAQPVNPGHGGSGGGHDNDDSDPTGNLSIELDVNGGDDEFTFTVILTDRDGDDLKNNFYYNGDYTGTIGSGDEITLEGGEKIVIRNLPEGTRYEVIIETADGYTYVIDGEEGVIHTGMNEAEFTATRTVPVADPSVTGVSRWLNTTDHIAYLTGYPGGAFGPDNNMTRAEVAQMFYALLNNKNVTITKTFPDVPADAWYATAVNTLASLGMVSGDENGNYRPNDPITRAEFCVIALAFAYEPENAVCYFGDVSRSDWFYTYVAQAASYGWIGGYTNGNFGPNDRITRAQVTTIVNNMLGRAADRDYVIDHQADLVQFTDLTRAHWGYFQIMEATNAHDYTKSNGTENWR